METPGILNILMMIIVGGIAGTLAARIVKGNNFGLIVNVILGIGGAVVGGVVFDFLGLTPGKHLTETLSKTFGVNLPLNFVGMIVSSTIGAILILLLLKFFGKKNREQ